MNHCDIITEQMVLAFLEHNPGWYPLEAIQRGVRRGRIQVRASLHRLEKKGMIRREGAKKKAWYAALVNVNGTNSLMDSNELDTITTRKVSTSGICRVCGQRYPWLSVNNRCWRHERKVIRDRIKETAGLDLYGGLYE